MKIFFIKNTDDSIIHRISLYITPCKDDIIIIHGVKCTVLYLEHNTDADCTSIIVKSIPNK